MKHLTVKDQKIRVNFLQFELEYKRLKFIFKNRKFKKGVRFFFFFKLMHFSKNTSFIRIKNRCFFTNKAQSVYRIFKLNRSTFKHLVGKNMILGLRRSSW